MSDNIFYARYPYEIFEQSREYSIKNNHQHLDIYAWCDYSNLTIEFPEVKIWAMDDMDPNTGDPRETIVAISSELTSADMSAGLTVSEHGIQNLINQTGYDDPMFDDYIWSGSNSQRIVGNLVSSDVNYHYYELIAYLYGDLDIHPEAGFTSYPNWDWDKSLHEWKSTKLIAVPSIHGYRDVNSFLASYIVDDGELSANIYEYNYFANVVDHSRGAYASRSFTFYTGLLRTWWNWDSYWRCKQSINLSKYKDKKSGLSVDPSADLLLTDRINFVNNLDTFTNPYTDVDVYDALNNISEFSSRAGLKYADVLNEISGIANYPIAISAIYKKTDPPISTLLAQTKNGYASFDGLNYIIPVSSSTGVFNGEKWLIHFSDSNSMKYYYHLSYNSVDDSLFNTGFYGINSFLNELEMGPAPISAIFSSSS